MTRVIQLSQVAIDGGTQPRCDIDESLVAEYAETMRDGAEFPPIVVFHDGVKFWLADGFHRTHAARQAGLDVFDADVRDGTRRDAILFSVGANAAHGSRRTNADKRKAVMTLLEDEEWSGYSNDWIAEKAAVSIRTVERYRASLTTDNVGSDKPTTRTYITKHGTKATMNTGGIGKTKKAKEQAPGGNDPTPEPLPAEPPAKQAKPRSKGKGIQIAHEAISVLKTIPLNDGLREDAFNIVVNWIEANRSSA